MNPFRLTAVFLALSAAPALAQPVAGEVQPDRLDLGLLHTGATAEASFMVFEAGNNANAKLTVTAPKFVKVLDTKVHTQQFGPGNNFTCGSVEIAIDTAAAGDLKGEVVVTLGEVTVKVPVTATVKPRQPDRPRVLIVGTPFQQYSTKEGSLFEAWRELVRDAGLDVSYLLVTNGKPVLRGLDLGGYGCVLLSADALCYQTADDVKQARAYAEKGGRVVVTANAFFVGSVKEANRVLDGYGLELADEEARGVGKEVILGKGDLHADVVKGGAVSARFFRASPVRVTAAKGRVLAAASGVGGPGDGFVAAAPAGKGEVIALGESLWWNWISTDQANGTDNAKLLRLLLAPLLDA